MNKKIHNACMISWIVIKKRNINIWRLVLLILVFGLNEVFSQQIETNDTTITISDTVYNQLDEVVITGTRVLKKIIDVPYSVV
ncbi:MAG: hypothetical protein K8S16_08765, partial [Bacteroidales bacterium]|nr:hypothetical protein [Bacteroidales bacterium]